ncbi:hypothetical protein [Psychrobacillus sp. FSL K6-1267]|uniref:hypothetical protein n=1 Tax=Psychrobacillus sp. FSL K6-1267 TaxID=2921543 RepID=UPI0030F7706A
MSTKAIKNSSDKTIASEVVAKEEVIDSNVDLNLIEEVNEKTVPSEEGAVFIYCGPTNNYLSRYTSFRNGYPIHLKEHFEKLPTLKALFIEPKNFAEFEQNVAQPDTIENIYFVEAKKYFSKVVNK